MGGQCLVTPAELQTPAFSLIYRGLASDAAKPRLLELFAKLLQLSPDQAKVALDCPPLHIAQHSDQTRMRKHQLGLANLGCISSVERGWQHHQWSFSDTLRETFEYSGEHANNRALALLCIEPRPSALTLQLAIRACNPVNGHILNSSQILLETGSASGAELRQAVQQLERKLQQHNQHTSIKAAVGLFPQDGHSLSEILDHLGSNLAAKQQNGITPPTGLQLQLGPECSFAGTAWLDAFQAFPSKDQRPSDIHAHWPRLATAAAPTANASIDSATLLRRWQQRGSARQTALLTLNQHCERADKLPALPKVVMKIHQLAQSRDASSDELSALVEQDPSLSARILAMVNSSWFGLRARLESIDHALVVIGREELAHLALMISSEKIFRGLGGDAATRLWQHSSQVADCARTLARRIDHPQISSIFTAALLHDAGKILLLSFEAPKMQEIQQKASQTGLPGYEIEREIWGHDHAEIGAMMLRHWGLPDSLCSIVAQHHGPLPGETAISLDAAIVALADHLVHLIAKDEQHGDDWRLRQAQIVALEPRFGSITKESLDLLIEDVKTQLHKPV